MKRFFEIFTIFFKIGLFTIGGGYAMLPIIQKEVVEDRGWMSDEEFLDAVSLTNSLPGPLAVNSATFVGYRVAGTAGATVAMLGVVAPSVIIILLIAMVFNSLMSFPVVQYIFNGIRPAVVALIFYAIVKLAQSVKLGKDFNWLVALAAFGAMALLGVHSIFVILGAALYGLFLRDKIVRTAKTGDLEKGGEEK